MASRRYFLLVELAGAILTLLGFANLVHQYLTRGFLPPP